PLCPLFQRGADKEVIGARRRFDQCDRFHRGQQRIVPFPLKESVEDDIFLCDGADQTSSGGTEGGDVAGVGFGDPTGGVDFVVKNHQGSLSLCLGVGGGSHGVYQVERSIRSQFILTPHGSGDNDRLIPRDGQVQIVGGLLQ